uniref:Thrombomodulin n=1 Tax=Sphaeramia orbicularis TaxID=375764 RepID=A0A673C6Y0_9TELE
MSLIFLLMLINSLESLSGAETETRALLTQFEKARRSCEEDGGYLMTLRDRGEEDALRALVSQIQTGQEEPLKLWIGLKLHRGECVIADAALRGFKWISGEEDSLYSNWGKDPADTCTERCVSVTYTSTGDNLLKWFYFKGMCKALALSGHGQITYTPPFSREPQRNGMKLFPLGTYALISCGNEEPHYSLCMNIDGAYRWNKPGPFCSAGKQNCAISNGGCEHVCRQDADEVSCLCKDDYDLDEDGFSCTIRNACSRDTCEHLCVITESGYSCRCPHGFKLDTNQRTCSDIDECQSQVCGNSACVNTEGSYRCACAEGYEMTAGKCSDVDECARSRCQHFCMNSIGSFSCYCHEGFTLSENGHSCVDINECSSNPCQYKCVNTDGSFRCKCPRGFYLNGTACSPRVTPAVSSRDPEDIQENFTESLSGSTVELQHQSPHTDAPLIISHWSQNMLIPLVNSKFIV